MKLAQSLALIITGSASFIIPFALASGFHVVEIFYPIKLLGGMFVACSSNDLTCDFFLEGIIGAGNVSFDDRVVADGSLPGYFKVSPGLCFGSQQLDFFQKYGTSNYDIYYHGGNGTSQGTCYPNKANITYSPNSPYSDFRLDDRLICYSTTICNSTA